jgi:hypothetical protein
MALVGAGLCRLLRGSDAGRPGRCRRKVRICVAVLAVASGIAEIGGDNGVS